MSKPIKLLVEVGPTLDAQKSGIGTYLDGLLRALSKSEDVAVTGFYFDFLTRRGFKLPEIKNLNYIKIAYIPQKVISFLYLLGLQPMLGLGVTSKMGVYFFSNYAILPTIKKRPTVLAVYDLGYLDVPQFMREKTLNYLRKSASRSIKAADLVVTISEFTKHRIEHHFPEKIGQVVVTPIPPPVIRTDAGKLPAKLAFGRKYILSVGTVEPRKNVSALLAGYEALPKDVRDHFGLVLAGGKGWKDGSILEKVSELKKAGLNVTLTGYITDYEKAALYTNASLFVLASHYEGFGIPILEAMQYGVPVSLSDIEVFHEVAADAALYFDRNDPADIAEKMRTILENGSVSADLSSKGTANLGRYGWDKSAATFIAAVRKLAKRRAD